MASNNIILILAGIFFFAISLNVIHFHSFGSGAIHHVDNEEFNLTYGNDDEIEDMVRDIIDSANLESTTSAETTISEESSNAVQEVVEHELGDNMTIKKDVVDYRHENNAFQHIMERSAFFSESCQHLPEHHIGEHIVKDFDTGVQPLPEHGVHEAMKSWLDKDAVGANDRGDYPMCRLPPTKSCDVSKTTVIIMSHTVEDDKRLEKLRHGISNLGSWASTGEIILVWNAPRSVLTSCTKTHCARIVGWDADDSHPLRIFYSLENGLHNNLLNRYHPSLEPKHEAVIYFDDDGPFHSEEAMTVGFELWKFNSDVQIGSMARNIRFPSKRMNGLQNKASDRAAKLYQEDAWQTHVHPYDTTNVQSMMKEHGLDEAGYPQFTPICHEQSGDVVEYNFYVFPNFKAHMSLPSGSVLHRNYLCFVWHPAFEELRQFILDHPTHPDDMTISTLVSHLTGKPLRTFPRNIRKPSVEDKRRLSWQNEDLDENTMDDVEQQSRRRLLWQQKDWGNMREEAIDSILNYFGSVNPGSVGWCAGTEYQEVAQGKGNMRYNCNPEMAQLSQISWMNEGGLGYDECH